MQPDLPHTSDSRPSTQGGGASAEPRLWVRRFALWRAPGDLIRDHELTPGLNVVWSPDPSEPGSRGGQRAIGHGSGKTLMCRLIRHCLGEKRFGPIELRQRMASRLAEGLVGIEVVVEGTTWSIVRPLGLRRTHGASWQKGLDQLAREGPEPSDNFKDLVEVLTNSFVDADARALLPVQDKLGAWLTSLAPLTRDQEARFASALAWRSKRSDSGSPVRDLSAAERLQTLRVLVSALEADELAIARAAHAAEKRQDELVRTIDRLAWQIERGMRRLHGALGLDDEQVGPEPIGVNLLRKHARQQLAGVAKVEGDDVDVSNLDVLRSEAKAAIERVGRTRAALAAVSAGLEADERVRQIIEREAPVHAARVDDAEVPTCPICVVPVDRALAEGCKVSHRLPDLQAVRERWAQHQRDRRETIARIAAAQTEAKDLEARLAEEGPAAEIAQAKVQRVERLQTERRQAWYAASRVQDDVEELQALLQEKQAAEAELADAKRTIDDLAERGAASRKSPLENLRLLDEHFTAVVRELIGDDLARGKVQMRGTGLELKLELGGETSSPAIDSVKVLAFDLALLRMGLAGKTRLPPFLIHDSPREADMGLSLYHRLFNVVSNLEAEAGPRFQYIITTTTKPPPFAGEPCIELSSAPPQRRLLGLDL